MDAPFTHIPVLLNECMEGLGIDPAGTYLDATAGGGGHAYEIALHLDGGRLFCIDKDPDAVTAAAQRLSAFGNTTVIEGDFRDAPALIGGLAER